MGVIQPAMGVIKQHCGILFCDEVLQCRPTVALRGSQAFPVQTLLSTVPAGDMHHCGVLQYGLLM